jgi:DNA-binding SARP family transcriptional activator
MRPSETSFDAMPADFHQAFEQARARAGAENWIRLSAGERSEAVYEVMGELDRHSISVDRQAQTDDRAGSRRGAPSPLVRLRLVGPMTAWTVPNGTILIRQRKARAILAIVALAAERGVTRSRVAELLWDARSTHQARASLRQDLTHLTQLFRAAGADVLRIERDYLALRTDLVWTDIDEIRRANPQQPHALSLMNSELLEDLNGISPAFDLWLIAERERLRDRSRDIAATVLRAQIDPVAIILAAQQVLQIERSNEGAWRAMMLAHAMRGERGLAIEAYDRCRTTLATFLDAVRRQKQNKSWPRYVARV